MNRIVFIIFCLPLLTSPLMGMEAAGVPAGTDQAQATPQPAPEPEAYRDRAKRARVEEETISVSESEDESGEPQSRRPTRRPRIAPAGTGPFGRRILLRAPAFDPSRAHSVCAKTKSAAPAPAKAKPEVSGTPAEAKRPTKRQLELELLEAAGPEIDLEDGSCEPKQKSLETEHVVTPAETSGAPKGSREDLEWKLARARTLQKSIIASQENLRLLIRAGGEAFIAGLQRLPVGTIPKREVQRKQMFAQNDELCNQSLQVTSEINVLLGQIERLGLKERGVAAS